MKPRFIIILFIFMTAGCGMPEFDDLRPFDESSSQSNSGGADDGIATIAFIDVGQGDSTLIVAPTGEALLIDAGPTGAGYLSVLPTIRQLGAERLIAIVATHYHADHIGGISEVLRGEDGIMGTHDDITPREGVYERGGMYEEYSTTHEEYLLAAEGIRKTLYPGDRIGIGPISADVVAANGMLEDGRQVTLESANENAVSIALVIEYGGFRMFVGGDLTGGGGTPPYDTPDLETAVGEIVGDVDVLQVNHHGSKTSTNQSFLDALSPEHAIISCGDDNDHFHPHGSVLERLLASGASVYQTEQCWTSHDAPVTVAHGNIVFTTDGSDYTITAP